MARGAPCNPTVPTGALACRGSAPLGPVGAPTRSLALGWGGAEAPGTTEQRQCSFSHSLTASASDVALYLLRSAFPRCPAPATRRQ